MKFTFEPESMIKLVESAEQGDSQQPGGDSVLQLVACQGRVWVSNDRPEGSLDAMVWEDGQGTVSAPKLLALLKSYRFQANVTIEAERGHLRIGGSSIPLISCCPWAIASEASQVDFATD